MSIYASVSKPQHSPPWAAWWRLSLLIISIITQVVARASVIGTANSITGPASTAARFAGVMLSDLERAWNEQYLLHCWQPSKDINQLIQLKIYAMLPALAVATRRPLYFFPRVFLNAPLRLLSTAVFSCAILLYLCYFSLWYAVYWNKCCCCCCWHSRNFHNMTWL